MAKSNWHKTTLQNIQRKKRLAQDAWQETLGKNTCKRCLAGDAKQETLSRRRLARDAWQDSRQQLQAYEAASSCLHQPKMKLVFVHISRSKWLTVKTN